ncbi:hypothetical protein K7432_001902 [Basidiobolus ranarum]|uniref:ATP synthase mitochondrial F1 complex assembly factor 1 n=1 Tax=Basidiobolus ranarum TaxID=34480 RepID=A0ABR2W8S4_9FUNG
MNAWGSLIRRATVGRTRVAIVNTNFRCTSVPSAFTPRSIFRRQHSSLDAQTFYEQKYAEKLKLKAEKEGLKTVTELKEKVLKPVKPAPSVSSKTSTATKSVANSVSGEAEKPSSSSPRGNSNNGLPSDVKSLENILKMDKILQEDAEVIGKIWTEYHASKENALSAVIPAETYDRLFERSKKYPLFVLPVPREEGAEMYLLQFAYHQCYFTSLLEYKTHGENARPYLTLTHYTDLKESKGVVLMHGEISDEPRILSPQDAQFLVYGLQQFYITGSERKQKMVEDFHHNPQAFDVKQLIEELEKFE